MNFVYILFKCMDLFEYILIFASASLQLHTSVHIESGILNVFIHLIICLFIYLLIRSSSVLCYFSI